MKQISATNERFMEQISATNERFMEQISATNERFMEQISATLGSQVRLKHSNGPKNDICPTYSS